MIQAPQPAQSHLLWDAFSVVCFPVGLYRVSSYYLGRCVAPIMLPSLMKEYEDVADQTRRNLRGEKKIIPTPEGHRLEGYQVVNPASNKWVVFFTGNSGLYQNFVDQLFLYSRLYQVNVLQVNYRGTGHSEGTPTCIDDLINDGKAIVHDLIQREHVDRNDIVLDGISLGGAVTLGVAKDLQIPAVVHNTFSSIEAMIPPAIALLSSIDLESLLQRAIRYPLENTMSIPLRLRFAIKDLIGSPIELVFHVAYYAYAFFRDLCHCELEKALEDLSEIVKALFLDTLLTFMGALALVSAPFTKTPLEWNANLNLELLGNKNSLITTLLYSSIGMILSFTGWSHDNVAAWDALRARKIAFFAPQDEVIPFEASLAYHRQDSAYRLDDDASHGTFGFPTVEYQEFLRTVLYRHR